MTDVDYTTAFRTISRQIMPDGQSSGLTPENVVNQVTSIVARQELQTQQIVSQQQQIVSQQHQSVQDMARIRDDLTRILPLLNQIDQRTQSIRRVLYGDIESGIRIGMIDRMETVEKKLTSVSETVEDILPKVDDLVKHDGERTLRERDTKVRARMLIGLASFVGATNLVGILALIALLRGIIHL
jgi:hypothetical protein